MAEEKEKPKWVTWLGYISMPVALFLMVMQGWQIVAARTPGPKLSVASSYGPFALPNTMAVLQANMNNPLIGVETPEGRIEFDAEEFGREREPLTSGMLYEDLHGFIELSIKNSGDRIAEEAQLQCDFDGNYRIRRVSGVVSVGTFNRRFSIEDIGQEEVVSISLWTKQQPTGDSAFVLTHTVGKHEFTLQPQTSAITSFFRTVTLVLFGAIVSLAAMLVWLGSKLLEARRLSKTTKEQTAVLEDLKSSLDAQSVKATKAIVVLDGLTDVFHMLIENKKAGEKVSQEELSQSVAASLDGLLKRVDSSESGDTIAAT